MEKLHKWGIRKYKQNHNIITSSPEPPSTDANAPPTTDPSGSWDTLPNTPPPAGFGGVCRPFPLPSDDGEDEYEASVVP